MSPGFASYRVHLPSVATIGGVKVIATIVVVVLVALGVGTYLVTRPPAKELDAQGRTWVAGYESWAAETARNVDRAISGMDFSTAEKNARLIEPLRKCSASLMQLGEPPAFLEEVKEFTLDACGEAEFAVQINDRDGAANLATTNVHLREAESTLAVARRTLDVELGET